MGVIHTETVPAEVRAAEELRRLEAMIGHPAHRSVAHVTLSALVHLEAAEAALAAGTPRVALHLAGKAEGIAEALRAVAGGIEGLREAAIATVVARRAAAILARVVQEASI